LRLPRFRRPPRPGRRTVSDAVELAGLGCLDGAAWWWQPIVGLLVLGGLLVFVGWVIGDEPDPQGQ
jgi:fatty acid desaturase